MALQDASLFHQVTPKGGSVVFFAFLLASKASSGPVFDALLKYDGRPERQPRTIRVGAVTAARLSSWRGPALVTAT